MAITRTIGCDVCGATAAEAQPNAGWPGWGHVAGIALDGVPNPNLCPECLAQVAHYIDGGMKHGLD